MGYRPPTTIYRLEFEGEEYAGLEVRMRAAKLGVILDAQDLASISPDQLTAADAERITDELTSLADHLVSWNVEYDDGEPVPPDLKGLRFLEMPLVARIFLAWQRAMTDVTPPLPFGSPPSRPPDVLAMPMESLA